MSPFKKVLQAVVSVGATLLQEEGVKHRKHGASYTLRGAWTDGFICPLGCGDSSGSCSFTPELYLKCHQCASKFDVFEWMARTRGTDAWTECKRLAERLGVTISDKKAPKTRSMPKRMTSELIDISVHQLLELDQAAGARDFLKSRELWNPRALAELGIGWLQGCITFSQVTATGEVLERYRGYAPGGDIPWKWYGTGTGGPGVWPAQRVPADGDKVLLLEGEWDVLTALIRLRFHRDGWAPCTFTSGAGSHPPPHALPTWFRGREVHLAYDNDTFQGPNYHDYVAVAKEGRKLENAVKAMKARLHNIVDRIAPMLEERECTVVFRKCPIEVADKWGADFRDWADRGGRDFAEWLPFTGLPSTEGGVEDVSFDEAFVANGKRVRTVVQILAVSQDDVSAPSLVRLDCDMGSAPACATCPAVRLFPDRLIDMSLFPEKAARALLPNADKNYIIKQIVKPPRACPGATVTFLESRHGSVWQGIRPSTSFSTSTANRAITIISPEPPSLTGDVEVSGIVHSDVDRSRAFIRADKIRSLDDSRVDLRPHLQDFLTYCPHKATRIEEVDEHFNQRWRDFTKNVTRVHGRREVTIAHDLLMHSAVQILLQRNTSQRGWLDIAIFGNTRSGKTATFDALMAFHGLGTIHSAVGNASRSGIVMGTDSQGMLRPGLFPRCDRKALVLDEWHHLVEGARGHTEKPASWIQTSRDAGYADSLKISGARKMATRVRFATISNWAHGNRKHYQHDCEHLGEFYGSPESIARLDFALAINDIPSQFSIDEEPNFWTPERTRTLIMRAWAMEAEQIHFEEGAHALAVQACDGWSRRLDTETIPLFTVEEKHLSVMRIATAAANVCFSHPEGKYDECLVRKVHVRWALDWLQWTWGNTGYLAYSAAVMSRETVTNAFYAERMLTVALAIEDPAGARNTLGELFGGFTSFDIESITGRERNDAMKWLSGLKRANVMKTMSTSVGDGRGGRKYVLTRGGTDIVNAIVRLAEEDPEGYLQRYTELAAWHGGAAATGPRMNPLGLEPIIGSDDEAVPF